MSNNDYADDEPSWTDLPSNAVVDSSHIPDVNDHWLETASESEQLIAMNLWFHSRYWDPANDTPYCSQEGGYMFIHGGPYDPNDVLCERFEGIVTYDVIEKLRDELYNEVGDEWARIDRGYDSSDYDEKLDVEILKQSEPFSRLEHRMSDCKKILLAQGDCEENELIRNILFGASISALEAFLWETMRYWVDHREEVIENIIKNTQEIATQSIQLRDVFEFHKNMKNKVVVYLQNIVWHRWDKVFPLYNKGLGIDMPSGKKLKEAILKRHDIVHRSGMNLNGEKIQITNDDVYELFSNIIHFCREIDLKIKKVFKII